MQILFKLLLLSLTVLFTFTACSKDEESCDLSSIEKTIVGEWVYPLTNETVEFKADGTLVDPDNSTIGLPSTEGQAEKTWQVNATGDVEVQSTVGNSSIDATIIINGFTCDEISTTYFGFPRTMERK